MSTEATMMTADGYVRVSRRMGREGPGYISPQVQREAIQRWADYKGVKIAKWHEDEDETGGSHDRPGLNAAVKRAVAGKTGGIVSWRIDRFSRFTEGGLRDLRRLQDAGARLAFVTEDIDTNGPMGRFVYTVMLAMSEYFLETIKAGWIAAKTRAVDRGAHIGPTPFGYVRNGDGTLHVHPERGPIVTEAFAIAARDGLAAATAYLDGLGLVHENGKRAGRPLRWTAFTARRFLTTKTYLGQVTYGDQVREDAHDALVTRAIFDAVQRQLGDQRRVREPKGDFPLSGLATCGTCGGPLAGGRGGPDARRMYRCSRRCEAPVALSAEPLEHHVAEVFLSGLGGLRAEGSAMTAGLETAEQALERAQRELAAYVAAVSAADVGAEVFAEGARQRREAVDSAHTALDELRARAGVADLPREVELRADWPTLPPRDRNALLRAAFDAVTVQRGRAPLHVRTKIYWKGAAAPEGVLERRGRR